MPITGEDSNAMSPREGQSMQSAERGKSGSVTGTHDADYDLISVLYHALKGAELYQKFLSDAEEKGDQEVVEFFEQALDEERNRSERAKKLLLKAQGQGRSH